MTGLDVLEKKLIFAHARIRTPYRQVYNIFTILQSHFNIVLRSTPSYLGFYSFTFRTVKYITYLQSNRATLILSSDPHFHIWDSTRLPSSRAHYEFTFVSSLSHIFPASFVCLYFRALATDILIYFIDKNGSSKTANFAFFISQSVATCLRTFNNLV